VQPSIVRITNICLSPKMSPDHALDPPTEYEDQHDVFVLAIGELRDANELAYRLATDPFSATQADFEAYDHYVDRATAYLRRSNDMLGKDYKTTGAAQEISLG
jgi:hypothetical protein